MLKQNKIYLKLSSRTLDTFLKVTAPAKLPKIYSILVKNKLFNKYYKMVFQHKLKYYTFK